MSANAYAMRRATSKRRQSQRRGFMVIAALVCLLVVMSLVGSMLTSALRARRELHTERDRRQTELLVEAGAGRAAARLAADPGFRGDTWEVPSADIVGQGRGRVTIEVTLGTDQDDRQILIVAEYRIDGSFPIRRSRTFHLTSSKAQIQE